MCVKRRCGDREECEEEEGPGELTDICSTTVNQFEREVNAE